MRPAARLWLHLDPVDAVYYRASPVTNYVPSDTKAPHGENFFNFKACEGSVPGSTPIEDKAENEKIVML